MRWFGVTAVVLAACVHPGPPRPKATGLEHVVKVVDERGAPISGAKVRGFYTAIEGFDGVRSEERAIGPAITDDSGRVWLDDKYASPFRMGFDVVFQAENEGFPTQVAQQGKTIVLGPPRRVAGTLNLENCAPGLVEIQARPKLPPPVMSFTWKPRPHTEEQVVRALTSVDGSFELEGLGPGPYVATVTACGAKSETSFRASDTRSLRLRVEGLGRLAAGTRWSSLTAGVRVPSMACGFDALAPGRLTARAPFAIEPDPECRFLLLQTEVDVAANLATWSLLDAPDHLVQIGQASRGERPRVGSKYAIFFKDSLDGRHLVVARTETQTTEDFGPTARAEIGRDDVVTRAAMPGTKDGDGLLELLHPDGRRVTVSDHARQGWSWSANGRWLAYIAQKQVGLGGELRVYDLAESRDALLSESVERFGFVGPHSLHHLDEDRLVRINLVTGARDILAEKVSSVIDVDREPARLWLTIEGLRGSRFWSAETGLGGEVPMRPTYRFKSLGSRGLLTVEITGLEREGQAWLVDTASGERRAIGRMRVDDLASAEATPDGQFVLFKEGPRVLAVPWAEGLGRAVGLGAIGRISPSGQWVSLINASEKRTVVARLDAPRDYRLDRVGSGAWLGHDVFLHVLERTPEPGWTGELRKLSAAEGLVSTLAPTVRTMRALGGGRMLLSVPEGTGASGLFLLQAGSPEGPR